MPYITYQGKMVQSSHKYVLHIIPPPAEEVIQLVHTKTGSQSMTLGGSGDVSINWGDGFSETVTLSASPGTVYSHTYSGAGGTIEINHPANLTDISLSQNYPNNSYLTSVSIPASAVNIQNIVFTNGSLSGHFTTHPEWVNLKSLALYNQTTGITSIDLHSAWTALQTLSLFGNKITTFDTHAWPSLVTFSNYQDYSVTVNPFTTYSWPNLSYLGVGPGLTSFTAHNTWVNLGSFGLQLSNNALPSSDVDGVLIALNDASYGGVGSITLDSGTNGLPSKAGIEALMQLESRGIDIQVNEGNDMITSWTNLGGSPWSTFTSSGTNISSMIQGTSAIGRADSNLMDISTGDIIRFSATTSRSGGSPIGPRLRGFAQFYFEPFTPQNVSDGFKTANWVMPWADISTLYFELSNLVQDTSFGPGNVNAQMDLKMRRLR